MKYIVIDSGGLELPILFPDVIKHKDIPVKNAISAGTVQIWTSEDGTINVSCFGESVSLKVKSRASEDSNLIKQMITGY
jgi:hypothetical protein